MLALAGVLAVRLGRTPGLLATSVDYLEDARQTDWLTLDCLICACDVYTWKLLRRDMGRSRSDAEARVRQMVSGILGG
jgi:hypothetical protein